MLSCSKSEEQPKEEYVTSIKLELTLIEGEPSGISTQYITPDNGLTINVIKGRFSDKKYVLEKKHIKYKKGEVFLRPYLTTENSKTKIQKKIYINGELDTDCITTVVAEAFGGWPVKCE